MINVGSEVVDDSGKVIGRIIIVYDALYWFKHVSRCVCPWDGKYPNWLEKTVAAVSFLEPRMSATRQEVSDNTGVPLEHVTDKLFYMFSSPQDYMVLPEDAIKVKEDI